MKLYLIQEQNCLMFKMTFPVLTVKIATANAQLSGVVTLPKDTG